MNLYKFRSFEPAEHTLDILLNETFIALPSRI
jgi:hypothetical protein